MSDPGPLLVVLTGPSGAGKDSVLNVLKQRDRPYHFTITATTREPRTGEFHEVDYYFVSKSEFAGMVDRDELLEHAMVYGQEKGVPKQPIRLALAAGQDVIMRTDIQGARHIKSIAPGAITIFIAPPSSQELERRLSDRAADSEEQMDMRLRIAAEELATAPEFDHTVVNDGLDRCANEIEQILDRERGRDGRQPISIDP